MEIRPWQACSKCGRLTDLVWPLPPHEELVVCDYCIHTGYESLLGCLTTLEARKLYHVQDLSRLAMGAASRKEAIGPGII